MQHVLMKYLRIGVQNWTIVLMLLQIFFIHYFYNCEEPTFCVPSCRCHRFLWKLAT